MWFRGDGLAQLWLILRGNTGVSEICKQNTVCLLHPPLSFLFSHKTLLSCHPMDHWPPVEPEYITVVAMRTQRASLFDAICSWFYYHV